MGKIEGVRIKNFGPLKDIVMGKTLSNQKGSWKFNRHYRT